MEKSFCLPVEFRIMTASTIHTAEDVVKCARCHKVLSESQTLAKLKDMLPEFLYLMKLCLVLILCMLWTHVNQLGQLSSRCADKWARNLEVQLREPHVKGDNKRKPKKWFKAFLNFYVRMWTKLDAFYGPILGKYAED